MGEASPPPQRGLDFRRRNDAEVEDLKRQVTELGDKLRKTEEGNLRQQLAEIRLQLERPAAASSSALDPNLLMQLILKQSAPAVGSNIELGPLLAQLVTGLMKMAQGAPPRDEPAERPGWMSMIENIAAGIFKQIALVGPSPAGGDSAPALTSGSGATVPALRSASAAAGPAASAPAATIPGANGNAAPADPPGGPPAGLVGLITMHLPQLIHRARTGADPEISAEWIAEEVERFPGADNGIDQPVPVLFSQLVQSFPQVVPYAPWVRDFLTHLKTCFEPESDDGAATAGDTSADNPDSGR